MSQSKRLGLSLLGDNSQISIAQLASDLQNALNRLCVYSVDAISSQILSASVWTGGIYNLGITWFGISLACNNGENDAATIAAVEAAAVSLNYNLSSSGPWTVTGTTDCFDVSPQPLGGTVQSVPTTGFPIL